MYFLKTRDDAKEKVRKIFADIGNPGKVGVDFAGILNSNEIEQLCIKQGVRLELAAPYILEENDKI